MRVIFNEEMKAVATNLDHMAVLVSHAIKSAGDALLNADLDSAQTVIDKDYEIDNLESNVIDQCLTLLARQNPVATDLREVVATMRLAATFERMGDLASHVAETIRRTWPESALTDDSREIIIAMVQFLRALADRLPAMLEKHDVSIAEAIINDDDALDNLHKQIFTLVESDAFNGSRHQLIDLVLLSRFLERIGDHAVSSARQVIFIVSGFDPAKKPTPDKDSAID